MAFLSKHRKVWHVYYRLRGKQRSTSTLQQGRACNDTARRILEKYRSMEACEKHGLPYADTTTSVTELVERYWASKPAIGDYTAKKKKQLYAKLATHLGERNANTIGVEDAEAFILHGLDPDLAESSRGTYRNFISALWGWGMKRRLVTDNPWSQLVYKRKAVKARRALTDAEIVAVTSKVKDRILLAVCLGLYQGARVGDCVNLYGEDVDLFKDTITFRKRKGSRAGDPKVEEMPLHPFMHDLFTRIDLTKGKRLIALRANDLGTRVAMQMREVGVNATHHFLRHTFITRGMASGGNTATVSKLAGHSSWNITQGYSHLGVDSMRGTLAGINFGGDSHGTAKVAEMTNNTPQIQTEADKTKQ